jgi:2-phospho-L-lactate guanylyltransferase
MIRLLQRDSRRARGTWAVVALKSPEHAKTRLSAVLDSAQRRHVLFELASRTIRALQAVHGIEAVAVVTPSAEVAQFARALGTVVIREAVESGTAAAFAAAVQELRPLRLQRLLMIAGDLPQVSPQALEAVIAAGGCAPDAVLVPDRHRAGTNALLCAPPQLLAPCFGADSLRRHFAAAAAAGIDARLVEIDALALDLDCAADLDELRRRDAAAADALLPAVHEPRARQRGVA